MSAHTCTGCDARPTAVIQFCPLHAAAPEMLAVLRAMLDRVRSAFVEEFGDDTPEERAEDERAYAAHVEHDPTLRNARAILAKIDGELGK